MDFNPLHTPRAASQPLASSASQSDAGIYSDEYIDSDDEDDNYSEGDEDEDDVASQMDMSENEFAHILGPQGDESCHLAESIIEEEGHRVDQPTSVSQSNSISASNAEPPSASDGGVIHQPQQQHTTKPHLTVIIKGVAYNTYRALLYYVRVARMYLAHILTGTRSYTLIILFLLPFLHHLHPHVSLRLRPLELSRHHQAPKLRLHLLSQRKEPIQTPLHPGRSGLENG